MSHGKRHHDAHDGNDAHDGFTFKMRLPSPLSSHEEHVMTRVIDCAMAVHKQLGPGFLESIYHRAVCIELSKAGIAFEQEKPVTVLYEGVPLAGQRIDLVVSDVVVVEIKAVQRFEEAHRKQVISYLRTMGLRAGLLINFNVSLLYRGLKRIVL